MQNTKEVMMSLKGNVAAKSPKMEKLETGKTYSWCTCGLTQEEPFCDTSHREKAKEFKSLKFTVDESKTYALCQCKQTNNPPYCDGSHSKL